MEMPSSQARTPQESSYIEQLYAYTYESCKEEETFHFLGFEFLQRMNIVQLQNELAELKTHVHSGTYDHDVHNLQATLRNYRRFDEPVETRRY